MLPGKTYKPEDILKILRKRYWVVLLPWAIIAAGTAGVARKLPDLYRSTAMIQVTPPQVPSNIVQQVTTVSLKDRLQATTQQILSRTRLESLIRDFNLYQDERKSQILQDVVEGMRRDIVIDPVKSDRGDTFTVNYIGRDPATVLKVTERLAGYFKDENAKVGQRAAEGTSSFVESQVEDKHRLLVATEERLKQYKLAHVGELPEQQAANSQAVQSINQQLNNIAQQINTDTNQKIALERSIAQLEGQADTTPVAGDPNATASQQLAIAKAILSDMLDVRRYKPDHPDVKAQQAIVKRLQAAADAEALKGPVGAATSPAERLRLARLDAWKDDLDRLNKQIQLNRDAEKQLRTALSGYQARIDRAPMREAELIELQRDYDTLKGLYSDLVAAREKSSMSVTLENRQMGEQFVLLDAARMPERPFSPNRLMINFFGILAGLAVGIGLVALLEYRDSTFKTDTELANALALPVLAVVPVMKAEPERRADFRRALMLNMGLASVVLICVAVLTYSFVFIR